MAVWILLALVLIGGSFMTLYRTRSAVRRPFRGRYGYFMRFAFVALILGATAWWVAIALLSFFLGS